MKTSHYPSVIFALIAAATVFLSSCNKHEYNARLKFDVSNELETKAILISHSESGADIIWEEGDEITFGIEIFKDDIMKPLNSMDGKLVYQEGKWKTYEAKGPSFVEQESITVSSQFPDSKVRIRFRFINGDIRNPDANTFITEWVRVIPFSEGHQTVLVTLPFIQ